MLQGDYGNSDFTDDDRNVLRKRAHRLSIKKTTADSADVDENVDTSV